MNNSVTPCLGLTMQKNHTSEIIMLPFFGINILQMELVLEAGEEDERKLGGRLNQWMFACDIEEQG